MEWGLCLLLEQQKLVTTRILHDMSSVEVVELYMASFPTCVKLGYTWIFETNISSTSDISTFSKMSRMSRWTRVLDNVIGQRVKLGFDKYFR